MHGMRVLHVNKFHYRRGGAEGYMHDVAHLQREQGWDVEFFATAHPDNVASTYDAHFPPYLEMEPPPSGLAAKARSGAAMLWNRAAATAIARVADEFRPDVVHLHNIYHHLSPSILQPLARRSIPMVMTLHDYKLACPTYQFLDHGRICEACLGGRFQHAALRRCRDGSFATSTAMAGELAVHTALHAYSPIAIFICPSRFMATKMRQARVFPERLRHLPHPMDTAGVVPKHAAGGPVFFAGRLSPEKGVDVLVEAVGRLAAERAGSAAAWPQLCVEVAGEGPERARLERQVEQVAPRVARFLGRLDQPQLQRRIAAATVTVVPSRWYENQPMAVLESLGAGVPVIGTNLGGIPELIRPGVDGELVAANDPAGLAAALRAAVADPVGMLARGRAGRDRVRTEFSPDRHLDGLTHLYAEAGARVRTVV